MVTPKAMHASNFEPYTIEWWAQVTEAPDDNNKKVLRRGTFQGSKVVINAGGQTPPIAGLGLKLEWKNAQKKAKKNITSDKMNNNIPIFKPFWTELVCWPSIVLSLITSRHQQYIINKIIQNPNFNKKLPPE